MMVALFEFLMTLICFWMNSEFCCAHGIYNHNVISAGQCSWHNVVNALPCAWHNVVKPMECTLALWHYAMRSEVPNNLNPFSTRPHQIVVWCNNSWLGFLQKSELCTKRKNNFLQKMSPRLSQLNVAMAHRNYFRWNNLQILKLATYAKIEDHYSRCKLATF